MGISKHSLRLSRGLFIVPQEFVKIHTLLSTLQESVNDAYTCMAATTRMQRRYAKVQAIKRLRCGSCFYRELSSLNARDKDPQSKWLPRLFIGE